MAADLWCLPIQINNQRVEGFKTSSYSAWDWQPDYKDMDLAACRDMWTPLAAPCKFLAIEFYSCDANMQPFDCQLGFDVTTDGSCNGMAFWFDLQLDEQSSISSSPFVRKLGNELNASSIPRRISFHG